MNGMPPSPVRPLRTVRRDSRQAGFTLIEVMLAISLVAAIATGMLLAMRNGLMTLDRIGTRLDENRRALALDRLLRGQLDGSFLASATCGRGGGGGATGGNGGGTGGGAGGANLRGSFQGTGSRMLLVSSYSMATGSRGYPVIVEYQFLPNADGTIRLVALEAPYFGPAALRPFCGGSAGRASSALVLADRLSFGRFLYQDRNLRTDQGSRWIPNWTRPYLPVAVRVEMAAADPLATRIPQGPVTVPLHTTQLPGEDYGDHP